MKPKFNIGDEVFIVQSSCNYGTKVPCAICFGKLKVTVILGNGEHVDTECGYCAAGCDPPSGYSTSWSPDARIVSSAITGVRRDYDGWRYDVGGYTVQEHEILTDRSEAERFREEAFKEVSERKLDYERRHFVTATKKQIWSVGYHRNRIEDCERTINWHKMRLCMIKEKQKC